ISRYEDVDPARGNVSMTNSTNDPLISDCKVASEAVEGFEEEALAEVIDTHGRTRSLIRVEKASEEKSFPCHIIATTSLSVRKCLANNHAG
ncbi:hypothetical protein DFQ30_006357, partial [Apophysomyces sp. BC1015]